MAFAGERQALRRQFAELHQIDSERLSDAHAFAAELDRKAPRHIEAIAIAAGEPGRCGNGVSHAVLDKLRPALAE